MIILTTILRLLWPFLQRFLAQRVVDYLEQRRQRRLQVAAEEARLAELIQELPPTLSPVPSEELPPVLSPVPGEELPPSKLLTTNAVWYTLAGLLIGSALSLILIIVLRDED